MPPLKILTVDDDKHVTNLIRMNLEDRDTKVIEASTALDGIRIIREQGADVVLLDLRLPDFSGWGLLGLLRMTASLSHILVMVVSVEPPDSQLIGQFRPDDYIQKPFDTRELVARVKRLMTEKVSAQRSF
jgi:DNA-binding response OmpR family regulator